MHMIMFILDDPNLLDAVLEAWDNIGISGVTIVESTGAHRRRISRQRLHLRFDFEHLLDADQPGHYTLFAIVAGPELVQQCLTATERIVGDLNQPRTGVLAAWPLPVVKGVPPLCPEA